MTGIAEFMNQEETLPTHVQTVRAAARDWLRGQEEGETIWWCEEHSSNGATNLHCYRDLLSETPVVCRIVECLLVPLGDNE